MNKLQIAVVMALCTVGFPAIAAGVNWVNKDLAQNTAPFQPNYATMLVGHEFGDTNKNVYLCRENDRSDGKTNVGKAIVVKGKPLSTAVCYIPWDGKEYKRTSNFDLFGTNLPFKWDYDMKNNRIHLDSYAFGPSFMAPTIYACLDVRTGTIGKLMDNMTHSQSICFVPMGGVEHWVRGADYLALTYSTFP